MQDNTAPYAVIVDPYLGASDFVPAFNSRGITTVALFTTPEPLASMDWDDQQYKAHAAAHFFDGDIDAIAATVASYHPLCIVPGNETGVELTDRLVSLLMPKKGNAPGKIMAQRNKWHQAQALREAGVPYLRQVCSDDPDEVATWIAEHGLKDAPLVLKPTGSAGTDSVYLVGPDEDWRPIFESILGAVNKIGYVNDEVLVMEFAQGPEFMVDTYSVDGQHGLTMVSIYGKHSQGNHLGIYDSGETLAPDDPRTIELYDYTKRVATAIGLRNCPGHAEVILTPAGPRLVEMAARFSGSCMQIHQRISTGDCQIERTVRHHVDADFVPSYEMRSLTKTTWLSANSAGRLTTASPMEEVHDLPTVRAANLPKTGMWVPSTEDIWTSLGWVILASDSQAAIDTDYARIRELEARLTFAS